MRDARHSACGGSIKNYYVDECSSFRLLSYLLSHQRIKIRQTYTFRILVFGFLLNTKCLYIYMYLPHAIYAKFSSIQHSTIIIFNKSRKKEETQRIAYCNNIQIGVHSLPTFSAFKLNNNSQTWRIINILLFIWIALSIIGSAFWICWIFVFETRLLLLVFSLSLSSLVVVGYNLN